MSETDKDILNDAPAESADTSEKPDEAPLNRAQRRALASGKHGGANSQPTDLRGPSGGGGVRGNVVRPSKQTRGSNRGK